MLIVASVLLGGLVIGWIANVIVAPRYYHKVVINLVMGVVGAAIWGQFMAPVFGRPPMFAGYYTLGGLVIGWAGAAVTLLLIGIVVKAGSR